MEVNSSLRIEAATEEDIPLILEFVRELAAYEKLLDQVEADEARLRQNLFGSDPKAQVLFAYEGNNPIGYAIYYFTYSTFIGLPGLYLEDLYVRPNTRNKGAGRALLQHLARLARTKDCQRIEWAVLNWNEAAIGFYKRLGAVPIDEWSVYRLEGEALDHLAS